MHDKLSSDTYAQDSSDICILAFSAEVLTDMKAVQFCQATVPIYMYLPVLSTVLEVGTLRYPLSADYRCGLVCWL